jgi:hypothetical protein
MGFGFLLAQPFAASAQVPDRVIELPGGSVAAGIGFLGGGSRRNASKRKRNRHTRQDSLCVHHCLPEYVGLRLSIRARAAGDLRALRCPQGTAPFGAAT